MNFGFTEEQQQLRQAARRFLDERCPITEVRRIMQTDSGYDASLWREIADLGWLGLTIPEEYGGSGLSWIDAIVVLEESGRSLFPSPLISTLLASSVLEELGNEEQKRRWLPGIADGSIRGSIALFEADRDVLDPAAIELSAAGSDGTLSLTGRKCFVTDPGSVDFFVVSYRCGKGPNDLALAIVESGGDGVRGTSFPMIDETKRMGNLDLEGARVEPGQILGEPGQVRPAIDALVNRGAIAVTAEAAGAVDAAIRLTARYANERTQFGHPIGHFQGVKHPLAEMYLDSESFKSLLYYATWALDGRPAEVPLYASLAKAYADEAFIRTGTDTVQLHGATGFTIEYDIQLYFKRSKWFRPMFGDAAAHYERAFALREAALAGA